METEYLTGPALCAQGIFPTNIKLASKTCPWVKLALKSGCRKLLRHWNSKENVSFKEWSDEMARVASYEQLNHKINSSLHIFRKIWGTYLNMLAITDQ